MGKELDDQIRSTLREYYRLREAARPIRARLSDLHNPDHSVSDEDIEFLLAPDKKFEEFYDLLRQKYLDLPSE